MYEEHIHRSVLLYSLAGAALSQRPIASGHSFDFTPVNQSGSFWCEVSLYHANYGDQVSFTFQLNTVGNFILHWSKRISFFGSGEGLRRAMVIYDPLDPYLGMYDVDDGRFQP